MYKTFLGIYEFIYKEPAHYNKKLIFMTGGASSILALSICYPFDNIRIR